MSAATILAALTSWWKFDGDMLDAHGPNDLVSNLVVAGYGAMKQGNGLLESSLGSAALASPIAFSPSSGKITLGGWLKYDGIATGVYIMGLTRHLAPGTQEAISIFCAGGVFSVLGWKDAGITSYLAESPTHRLTAYPITVRAQDSLGQVANSSQVIRIDEGSNPPGSYFVVATWDDGTLRLYVDSVLVASTVAGAVYTSPLYYFQVGAVGYGLSGCGLDEVFMLDSKALSQADIDYLYNMGAGKSYADLVADAA